MLKKVIIENFQSHKKSRFEFVPGVNVIIGASDAGKSAIFNAINWVATNRPLGESFRSEWGGETQVEVFTAEGDRITRYRSQSDNEYIVNTEVLTAFGTEVPQEILDVLRLDPQNIQAQMDPPFLLSLTPGEAAKMLNKAASIDEIDSGISALRKSLYRINSDLEYKQNELVKFDKEIDQYSNLEEIEELIICSERLQKAKEDAKYTVSGLRLLQSKGNRLGDELNGLDHLLKRVDPIMDKVEGYSKVYLEKKEKNVRLKKLIKQTIDLHTGLSRLDEIGDSLVLLGKAGRMEEKAKANRKQRDSLGSMIDSISYLSRSIAMSEQVISTLQKDYDRKMPKICPLCGK